MEAYMQHHESNNPHIPENFPARYQKYFWEYFSYIYFNFIVPYSGIICVALLWWFTIAGIYITLFHVIVDYIKSNISIVTVLNPKNS